MEILVCVKRVPDTSENETQLNQTGNDIERDDLVYSINEWDNYAVEEAIQIVARVGGNLTVVTIGGEDDEEILRREMAMGANHGVLISDEAFNGSDGKGMATILKAFVQKNHYDLVLTGVQAEDGGAEDQSHERVHLQHGDQDDHRGDAEQGRDDQLRVAAGVVDHPAARSDVQQRDAGARVARRPSAVRARVHQLVPLRPRAVRLGAPARDEPWPALLGRGALAARPRARPLQSQGRAPVGGRFER